MSRPAISVENLGKSYRIGLQAERHTTFREALVGAIKTPLRRFQALGERGSADDTFWALKDVSFDVQPGEVVGIIGRNGAGKSTLLKVLSRITEPTEGLIRMRGRVASLLEVGTGFHPELTGRENIYLNGAILGMRKVEIDRKFDEIVAFAGVEEFLETPVKRYSSGMYVRLAFAVAAHLDPEILIIDEVLAVGDANYQRKCIDRMQELAISGRTILFVSHNMDLIPRLCDRAILLDRGRINMVGPSDEVSQAYMERSIEDGSGDLTQRPRTGSGIARFTQLRILDGEGNEVRSIQSMCDLIVEVKVQASRPISDVAIAISICSIRGHKVITSWTGESGFPIDLRAGIQGFRCRFRALPLRPGGKACLRLWMATDEVLDAVENALVLDVLDGHAPTWFSRRQDQGFVICDYAYERM